MDKVKTLKGISALGLTALLLAAATATTMAAEDEKSSMGEMHAQMTEVSEAMESGDYETWSSLMKDSPMAESISEDLFNAMTEMHELRQSIEAKYGVELPGKRAGLGGIKMKMHDGMKGECPFSDDKLQ